MLNGKELRLRKTVMKWRKNGRGVVRIDEE